MKPLLFTGFIDFGVVPAVSSIYVLYHLFRGELKYRGILKN